MLFIVYLVISTTSAFLPLQPIHPYHTSIWLGVAQSPDKNAELLSSEGITADGDGREERATRAKEVWSTIALQPTRDSTQAIDLLTSAEIYDAVKFRGFCKMKGTYFINGLASCKIGDRLMHPFEAHGFVKAFVFDGQGALVLKKKVVQTDLTKKELKEKKPLARGVMSTIADLSFPSSILNMISPSTRDTANLVSYLWPPPDKGDSLLITCTDNGEPHVLDPRTLETRGKLVDIVPKLSTRLAGAKLLAHARVDGDRIVMCINDLQVPGETNEGNTTMTFLELDIDWNVISSREHTTRFMVFHDWILTENYYVVPKNPAVMQWPQLAEFILGMNVGTSVFKMDESCNGEIVLIPRQAGGEVHDIRADKFFNIFHFGPTYEEDGHLILHGCAFDSYTFGREMGFDGASQTFDPIDWGTSGAAPAPHLDRYVIDLKSMTIVESKRIAIETADTSGLDVPVDMPTFRFEGKPSRYAYLVGACRPEGWFPFRSIVKLDLKEERTYNWDAGDDCVVCEPMFLPRSEDFEDDGFVISIVHDAKNEVCTLVVWDAPTFGDGPIARVELGDLMPWCVHGSWYPGYDS